MLCGPRSQSLKVVGQFTGDSSNSHGETIFIVKGLKNDLPAFTALQLARCHTQFTHQCYEGAGLGNFGELYDIQVKDNAKL